MSVSNAKPGSDVTVNYQPGDRTSHDEPRLAPSIILQRKLKEAFDLSESDLSTKSMCAHLEGITHKTSVKDRIEFMERGLREILHSPAAASCVRERLDRNDPHGYVLQTADGRRLYIVRQLGDGEGAFGEVYIVKDPALSPDDPKALQAFKQLRTRVHPGQQQGEWISDGPDISQQVLRFSRENQFLADLSATGIQHMFPKHVGSGERVVEGPAGASYYPFISSEFARCIPLKQLRRPGQGTQKLRLPLFYDLAAHTATTLHTFHGALLKENSEQGGSLLVHRDVKPSNFLLNADGSAVKLIDFGMVREIVKGKHKPLGLRGTEVTVQGTVMGTQQTMAPEQWGDASAVEQPADIYSLFCTLYYLLTGKNVFPYHNSLELLKAHTSEIPEHALKTLKAYGLPPDIIELFRSGLEKKPGDRPDGHEVIERLLAHSTYGTRSPQEFFAGIQDGTCGIKISEKVRSSVTSPKAPLPSGFEAKGNDGGAEKLASKFNDEYRSIRGGTRNGVRRLLWPVVIVGGGAAAAALGGLGWHVATNSSKPGENGGLVQPDIPVKPDVLVEPEKPVEEPKKPELFIFEKSKDGKEIKSVTLFNGTPAKVTFALNKEGKKEFEAHTKDGVVHGVTFWLKQEQIAKLYGCRLDEIPASGTGVSLVIDPGTQRSVMLDQPGPGVFMSFTPDGVHAFTDHERGLRSTFGDKTQVSPHNQWRDSEDIQEVLRGFPDKELDPLAHENHENMKRHVGMLRDQLPKN